MTDQIKYPYIKYAYGTEEYNALKNQFDAHDLAHDFERQAKMHERLAENDMINKDRRQQYYDEAIKFRRQATEAHEQMGNRDGVAKNIKRELRMRLKAANNVSDQAIKKQHILEAINLHKNVFQYKKAARLQRRADAIHVPVPRPALPQHH